MTARVHWRCFHCGETFTKAQERWAREHFGRDETREPVCLIRTAGESALLSALRETHSAFTAFLLICAAWLIVSGYTSINAVVKAELFPTSVRATGVALPYALTVSIFGGTAEPIALALKQAGHEAWFYDYLTGCIFMSLLVYGAMRDTKKESRI